MKEPMTVTVDRVIIRSKTNGGDPAKQEFCIAYSESKDDKPALCIRKLVLTENFHSFCRDFKLMRQFRGKYLFLQEFSIKCETLWPVLFFVSRLKPINIDELPNQ
jgi:hypothetical protein